MRLARSLAAWATALLCACASPAPTAPAAPLEVQVLALNDFHGALEPTPLPGRGRGGGAPLLAAKVKQLRTARSVLVSAGDLVGGSPLASGLFHDEAAVEVMNALGLAYDGVGNHEFDEGLGELLRLRRGGCHPVDGCRVSQPFRGARFELLAANVVARDGGAPVLPRYALQDFDGVKVAFVGVTLRDTPGSTVAANVADLEFLDEVETVNALLPELEAAGARAVVVLLHQGGFQRGGPDACEGLEGPVVPIAAGFDPRVSAVLSGHTHAFYNCRLDGRPVTSAGSRAQGLTDLRLRFGAGGRLESAWARNVLVEDDLPPDPEVTAIAARYLEAAAPIGRRRVGTLAAGLDRKASAGGDSPLGNVVADAMLASARGAPARAQVALMNSTGLRADLAWPRSGDEASDGEVTFAEAFTVQPFANTLVTVTVTGAELEALLEASVGGQGKHLEVAGLTFGWNPAAPAGARVDPSDVRLGSAPLALDGRYRVVTNSILADASSGYAVLARRTDAVPGGVDLDALVAFLQSHPALPPPEPRVRACASTPCGSLPGSRAAPASAPPSGAR